MKNNNKSLKAVVLSIVLVAGMLLPAGACAQENSKWGGGLFGRGDSNESGWFRSMFDVEEDDLEGGIDNYGIGEEVPMGSGIVILLGAGLGYMALKKKEDEQ